jgi:hypothetical protein
MEMDSGSIPEVFCTFQVPFWYERHPQLLWHHHDHRTNQSNYSDLQLDVPFFSLTK